MATLQAEKGGKCNQMDTKPTSQQCGLATAIMEICFGDEDVGALDTGKNGIVDIIKDYGLTGDELTPFESYEKKAHLNCQKVVFVKCDPDDRMPYEVCSAYLTAAINTGYDVLFTAVMRHSKQSMEVMKLKQHAKPEFKDNAKKFVTDHGNWWFFCTCKSDRKRECLNMAEEEKE